MSKSSAELIWSIQAIKQNILSYIPRSTLCETFLTLSKEDFHEVVKELYVSLTTEEEEKIAELDVDEERLISYRSSVRYLTLCRNSSMWIAPPSEEKMAFDSLLLSAVSRYPNLIWIFNRQSCRFPNVSVSKIDLRFFHLFHFGTGRTSKAIAHIHINNSTKPLDLEQLISSVTLSLGGCKVELQIDDLIHQCSEDYDVPDKLEVVNGDELITFFNNWTKCQGIFKWPVNAFIIEDIMTCPFFLWYHIKKQKNCGLSMYSHIYLRYCDEEEIGSTTIMDIIKELAPTTLDFSINGGGLVKLHSTIQDFFAYDFKWPRETKLKRLQITLTMTYNQINDTDPLNMTYNGPQLSLEHFSILLLLPPPQENYLYGTNGRRSEVERSINNLPAISSIAKAMYSMGGPNCRYSLGFQDDHSSETERHGYSVMLYMVSKMFDKEMVEIINSSKEAKGWTHVQN